MSATTAPATTRAVASAQTAQDLVVAAEQNPQVKADLQSLFDSYSHNPVIAGLASVAGIILAQQHVNVDSMLLTIAIGLAVTALGYLWQFVAMKLNKTAMPPPPPKGP